VDKPGRSLEWKAIAISALTVEGDFQVAVRGPLRTDRARPAIGLNWSWHLPETAP